MNNNHVKVDTALGFDAEPPDFYGVFTPLTEDSKFLVTIRE